MFNRFKMARSNVFTKLPDNWINMSENQFCRLTHQLKAFGENPLPGINLQHPDYIEYNNMISEFKIQLVYAMSKNKTTIQYPGIEADIVQAKLAVETLADNIFDLKEQLEFESNMEVRFYHAKPHTNGF